MPTTYLTKDNIDHFCLINRRACLEEGGRKVVGFENQEGMLRKGALAEEEREARKALKGLIRFGSGKLTFSHLYSLVKGDDRQPREERIEDL